MTGPTEGRKPDGGLLGRLREWSVFFPTLAWELVLVSLRKDLEWWTPVDDTVILGALPFPPVVREVHARGVRRVVNLCEEFSGPRKLYDSLSIRHLHLPTRDFTSPSVPDLERAWAFVSEAAGRQEKVYIHCKAGRGRSATVVLCWLARTRNLDPEEAQRLLESLRPQVNKSLHLRPEARHFLNLGDQVTEIS